MVLQQDIHSQHVNVLEPNTSFSTAQHGFRKYFSCETNVSFFTHNLYLALYRGFLMDSIFLEFLKHPIKFLTPLLLLKLNNLNIDANVAFSSIPRYLTYRYQFVTASDRIFTLFKLILVYHKVLY